MWFRLLHPPRWPRVAGPEEELHNKTSQPFLAPSLPARPRGEPLPGSSGPVWSVPRGPSFDTWRNLHLKPLGRFPSTR